MSGPPVGFIEAQVGTGIEVEPGSVRLLASARSFQGERILGASADWSLTADPTVSSGALYAYELDPGDPNTLLARIGEHQAEMPIQGRGSAVDSGDIGCSTTGAPSSVWLLSFALPVLFRRRL